MPRQPTREETKRRTTFLARLSMPWHQERRQRHTIEGELLRRRLLNSCSRRNNRTRVSAVMRQKGSKSNAARGGSTLLMRERYAPDYACYAMKRYGVVTIARL
jgi:hypothetical protein